MIIEQEKTIGQIVADDYRTASVFKSYGIDFCCKGNRTVSEVCNQKDISVETLHEALESALQPERFASPNFNRWALDLLVDYIEKKHHRYVRGKVPELGTYLEKICKVHGKTHPELFEIKQLFDASAKELFSHMQKEENILFPLIRAMAEAEINGTQNIQRPSFGTVGNPINMMMHEHDTEGERFRKIAALANDYTPPVDACSTYQVAFALLKEFEEDLHQHIHLENNIIFPKAIELEKNCLMPKPIKRLTALQPISREHHHGLLLSWKIREGLKRNIEPARIKQYTDWFWKNHLQQHFEFEEKYIFPILGKADKMVNRAKKEHGRLRRLFISPERVEINLSLIEEELVAHIRFEERVLFNEIQKVANKEQLALLESSHQQLPDPETWEDEFWLQNKN